MGKGSAPTYNEEKAIDSQKQAAELSQLYSGVGLNDAFGGSVNWTGTGADRTQNVTLGANDQQRQSMIGNALQGMSLDPAQAQQSYYNNALAMQQPAMDRQTDQTFDRMVKMGIDPTSTGSQEVLGEMTKNQNLALNDLSTNAMQQGQQYLGQQIGNVGSMQNQINNPLAGYQQDNVSFQDTYGQKFNSDMEAYKQKSAGRNALIGSVSGLAGSLIGGIGSKGEE